VSEKPAIRWQLMAGLLALVVGALARIALIQSRGLGFDEVLTLVLGRYSIPALIDALRLESNAPLHYLVVKALLAPLGNDPSRLDFLVRYVSLAAAVLHVPLLWRACARLGTPESAWRVLALYGLAPLAVYHDSEARAYALTSLLVLYALDQALELRAVPGTGAALRLTLAASLAVLAHLNALFPLAGLAFLFRRGGRPARLFALSGASAALLAAPWLAIALHQPAGSIAWVNLIPRVEAVQRVFVNLALATDQEVPLWLAALVGLGVLQVFLLARAARRSDVVLDLLGVIVLGAACLVALALVRPTVLGPGRVAVSFVPLVALAVGTSGMGPTALSLAAAVACLFQQAPGWSAASPVDRLADSLVPSVRSGWSVCAVGIYGPELDYKLRLAVPGARVRIFPSDVARHRGWHDDAAPADHTLQAEARAAVEEPRPRLFVLPWGARASGALGRELRVRGGQPWGRSAYVEIVALPSTP
jgi:hypothetical protein